jgi:hypothetical protein
MMPMPWITEVICLPEWLDEGELPASLPMIEQDEYAFIEVSLQRYHDRDFK